MSELSSCLNVSVNEVCLCPENLSELSVPKFKRSLLYLHIEFLCFSKTDLLVNPLNQSYHLILCRMLLQHLYFRDVTSLLSQFSQSSSSFLLTTTFPGNQYNEELVADAENPGESEKVKSGTSSIIAQSAILFTT